MSTVMDDNDRSRLLENALDAVVGCDDREFVIYWNRHAEKIFGWTKAEVVGRKMADLIVPERFRAAHRAGMARFLGTGTSNIQNRRIEVPAVDKSGREFTIELTITSMRDGEGRHKFYSFLRDISPAIAARQAIERARDLQTRFSRSATAIDLGAWYCDLPFDKMEWSPEVRRHFFMPPDVVVDRDLFFAHLHPDDRERTRLAVEATLEKNAPYDIVYRTIDPGDPTRVRYVRSIGWLDCDQEGVPRRFDGITRDVTSEYHRQIELEEARDEAERANRLKSSFLANMSHEIRTPLGAMLGFAQLLKDDDVPAAKRREYLDVLLKNGQALSGIINDVLDISKIEAGRLEIELEEFELVDLVGETVALFGLEAQKRGLGLSFDRQRVGSRLVRSDRGRLRQILINLINNALKFTAYGSISLVIDEITPDLLFAIDVVDSGIGVAASENERIFEIFEQADNTITRRFGGTGLGLALSRSLARQLGGDVVLLRTSPDGGSTFRLTVRDRREVPVVAVADPTTPAHCSLDLAGTRVLVADDSPDNRFLLTEMLEREGVRVTCAVDGREACMRATTETYDLVLMDIQMPGLDGYAATREIRRTANPPPVIAVTAHARIEDRRESEEAGCVDHLTKPIKTADLLRMIERHRRPPGLAL